MNFKSQQVLKILIVNQNISARCELKNMLASLGQADVDLMKDGRELVGREQAFKYDLVFLRDDLDHSLCGVNLVRYLTRTNLVPKWCKFVILSDDIEATAKTPIFRHLKTEYLEHPLNYKMIEATTNATIQSLDVFKSILRNINQITPSSLIKSIRKIDSSKFDATHRDELLELKIKLLLKGRRPDIAWSMSEKIHQSAERLREQLFISFSTGQEEDFLNTLETTERENIFPKGYIYYRTYYSLFRGQTEVALKYFERLESAELTPNEIECYALLLQQVHGLEKAIAYLDQKSSTKAMGYDLANNLSLARLSCYSMALLCDDLDSVTQEQVLEYMTEVIKNNTWSKGSFRYDIYKPFILLGIALIQNKDVAANFEKLYELRHQLDVKQLNILLFVAQRAGLSSHALEVHKMLERNAARLEMSPELISHEITHQAIMKSTLDQKEQQQRHMCLAENHTSNGRLYRALRKYYSCHKQFGSDDHLKLKMLALMSELGLKKFWEFKSIQMLDGIRTEILTRKELELAEKLKQSA